MMIVNEGCICEINISVKSYTQFKDISKLTACDFLWSESLQEVRERFKALENQYLGVYVQLKAEVDHGSVLIN